MLVLETLLSTEDGMVTHSKAELEHYSIQSELESKQ